MGNPKNPIYNQSGCADPTAFYGLKPVIKEEHELDRQVHVLIKTIRYIVDLAGFEVTGRIYLKHKSTGKEFR